MHATTDRVGSEPLKISFKMTIATYHESEKRQRKKVNLHNKILRYYLIVGLNPWVQNLLNIIWSTIRIVEIFISVHKVDEKCLEYRYLPN